MKDKRRYPLLFILLSLLLNTACTMIDDEVVLLENEPEITIEDFLGSSKQSSTSELKGKPRQSPVTPKKEKVIESWESFYAENLPVIAAIPERNIYLYGIKPSGVILYIDGEGHYYDWDYHSTRFTLPKIALNDFDHDGDEEISVILQLNNEDGFAEEELHIIEITNNDDADNDEIYIDLAPENIKYCVYDHCFAFADCIRQLKEHVQIKTFYEAGILMAEVKLYDTVHYVNLRQLQLLDPKIIMGKGERIGNIVHFNMLNDKIIAQLSLGIISKSYKTPLLIGNLSLEILYNGTGFGYTNVEFVSRNGLVTQKTLTKE